MRVMQTTARATNIRQVSGAQLETGCRCRALRRAAQAERDRSCSFTGRMGISASKWRHTMKRMRMCAARNKPLRLVFVRSASEAPRVDNKDSLPSQEIDFQPPSWAWRGLTAFITAGQVLQRILRGKVHYKNTFNQLAIVGPASLGVCLLTAGFVGMAFTIQFVREFTRLGLTRSIGGVLALAMSRELTPVVTAIIIAGRVGSAFAAELGTMQVSEQTDSLRVLRTDPIDYLITPRVIACSLAMPVLTLICFTVGMGAAVLLAEWVYDVGANVIVDSALKALQPLDLISMLTKSLVFGVIISVVSCAWGSTTTGGAKGVGESTTSAVVHLSCRLVYL